MEYGLAGKVKDLSSTFSRERVLDLLFPKFCAGCNEEGSWLCKKCLPVVDFFHQDMAVPNLDGVTALFNYGENTQSKLIKMFKYDYLSEVAGIFENIISGINFFEVWKDCVIIPVPLHARRERERGFNQAEILAGLFSKKFGLSVNKNLYRIIYTQQQAKLSGEERRQNLQNAFVWRSDRAAPKKVLLVDDVFTTGATMQECAGVLKNNGAEAVCGLVLARG